MSEENNQRNVPDVQAESGDDLPVPTLEAQLDALKAERDRLAAENSEMTDWLLRRQADFENYRRRVERDRSDFIQFAAMELVRELLPILDDFERAMQVETADREFVKGVELIYNRLYDTLRRAGLEPIETAGKPFDPNLHQALDKVETEEADEHTILHEYQRGYNFKGKLLRPSMVKVAVRP